MKTFFKLLPSLFIPMVLVFAFVIGYKGLEERDVIISKIEKATKNVDHSKFEELKKEFATPQEMTEACLKCHNQRGPEIMQTAHWQWLSPDSIGGGKVDMLGKRNVLNNFCVGINSNEKLCSSCHIGFGWSDKSFDFSNQNNIDCIVCHDNTGKYHKKKGNAGYPEPDVDLNYVAQNVGPTTNNNCSNCHAKGGGGNNVKHGDLDIEMNDADICTREVDVHMSKKGADLNCSQCHITSHHQIRGTGPMTNSFTKHNDVNRATCTECHTDKPHIKPVLNDHYNKVACQTCHIPRYAKINKTQVYWDWSTAGLRDGESYKDVSEDGMKKEDSGHGTALYAKNLKPEYKWWNGKTGQTTLATKIDPTDTIDLNPLYGDYNDLDSKIYPFKIMRGKQPYDTKNNTFVQMRTFGPKGSGAFWSDFDWDASIRYGMEYAGFPYSGKFDFADTRSYWPVNHMVSPANEALTCTDCHSQTGVLAGLDDFYLPGRDVNNILDWIGKLFVLFAAIGVIIHSTLRMLAKKKGYK
ncbi:MAG: tetrathionate reductase family octaheme c-type cytochrome [Bacteroidales bacterium]|nr:tetrathionate reductase family octaheme c-type cytochrome [Bacteroidales bacterium]